MNKRMYEVLLAPLISEKATKAADREHSVVFWVKPDATKPEIRNAVENLFSVKVRAVRTVRFGTEKTKKKAYVSLAAGHEITFASEA